MIQLRIACNSAQILLNRMQPRSIGLYRYLASYQTSKDRDLRRTQVTKFPKLTQQVNIQNKEVEQYDGYKMVEPLIDPNQKPHELHLIKKVGKVLGEPWWVKKAIRKLGFKSNINNEWDVSYTIQPNTTEINNILWICKHVVKITPIKFKNGYPTEQDIGNTRLNLETGEFEVIKPIEYTISREETTGEELKCFKMNGVDVTSDLKPSSSFNILIGDLREQFIKQKQMCKLNDEYFPAEYDYKYDQDKPGVIRIKGPADTSIKEDEVTD